MPAAPPASTDADLVPLDALAHAAECLRTLAHPHRLRIVEALLAGPRSVGELARLAELTQPATSEHLRLMRDRGLLAAERDGRKVFYRVAEPGLAGILHCVRSRFGPGGAAHNERTDS